jgi:hypothetical protein
MPRPKGSKNKITRVIVENTESGQKEDTSTSSSTSFRLTWSESMINALLHYRVAVFKAKFEGSKANAQRSVAWHLVSNRLNLDFFEGQEIVTGVQAKNKYISLKKEYNDIVNKTNETGNRVDEEIHYPEYWDQLVDVFGSLNGMGSVSYGDSSVFNITSDDDNNGESDEDEPASSTNKRKREVDEVLSSQRKARGTSDTKKNAVERGLESLGKSLENAFSSFGEKISQNSSSSEGERVLLEIKSNLERQQRQQMEANDRQQKFNEMVFAWMQKNEK